MLLEFVRWLQGYVYFKIIGKSPERFINIVTKNRLTIWNTVKKDSTLYASMYVRDYKDIREFAKTSRVRLKIVSRHGLPFFIKKYKNRVGVLVGVFVFIIVVYIMSCFVWTIDVTGLETISYSHLLSTLKENGLYVGAYKKNASFITISRDTMLDIEDIGWMSINVIGSHASVEIKEKAKSPKVENTSVPANVKASTDGLILSINTYQGEAFFEEGSAVVKDQLLVSGVVEDKLGGVKLVRANAQVIAQTTHKQTFEVSKIINTTGFKEEKTRKRLNILWLDVPFSFAFADEKASAMRFQNDSLYLFDTFLPVSVSTQRLYEKQYKEKALNDKKAQEILLTWARLYECFNLSDAQVKSRNYEFFESDGKYTLECTFLCVEDIAYKSEIDAKNITIDRVLQSEKENTQ